jgi:hypothetical protein
MTTSINTKASSENAAIHCEARAGKRREGRGTGRGAPSFCHNRRQRAETAAKMRECRSQSRNQDDMAS